jgi:hypothetical protein
MAKAPAMTTHLNVDTAHRTITVVVEHTVWQSFSRAVMPRARRDFKRWIYENVMFGDLRQTVADLGGQYVRGDSTRCFSTVTFTY